MSMIRIVMFLAVCAACVSAATKCSNSTGCAYNEYCDQTNGGYCYSCADCTTNCPKNCACSTNADCPAYLSYCPGVGKTCYGCNTIAPFGQESKREAACKCSNNEQCPNKVSSGSSMPTYCGKKSSDSFAFCHDCDACYDPVVVNGSCPYKCESAYACKKHTDCPRPQYCGANHQCIGCGPHCYKADPNTPQDGPIDSVCPISCCGFVGLQYHRDGTPMFYAPCTSGLTYTFRAGYSEILNTSTGTACTSTLDKSNNRDIYTIRCNQLSNVFTTCNKDEMHFYASVFNGTTGALITQDDVESDNTFGCSLAGIVGSILLIVLLAVFIPLGLCCLAAILFWCGCVSICGRSRTSTTTTYIQQGGAAPNYNSMNAPVYNKV